MILVWYLSPSQGRELMAVPDLAACLLSTPGMTQSRHAMASHVYMLLVHFASVLHEHLNAAHATA